ncbi:MAG: SDR family NAD(P)-dependent oxidoreductase [Usitatibacter sp.]
MATMNLYIVTGTTKGLGAALALLIARDARNELVALARAAEGPIPGGFRIEADLADAKSLEAACDRLDERLRGKGYAKAVLINNAGLIPPVGPLDQVGAAELERNLVVNLVAPMRLMRRFLRATAEVPLRRIINISSGAARRPIFGWSAYCAAKAGLDMASRCVALEAETRKQCVEVASLAPGVIDTSMQEIVRGATAEQFVDVERFRQMKADGVLRPAADVAADILRLEAAGKLKGEAILDLRQIA